MVAVYSFERANCCSITQPATTLSAQSEPCIFMFHWIMDDRVRDCIRANSKRESRRERTGGGKKAKMKRKSRVKRCRAGICGSLGNLIEKLGYAGSCVCQRIKGTARHKLD